MMQLDKFKSVVDVRSPVEFKEDHIPNAVNIPLLSDEERAIVGKIYSKDKKEAVDTGMEFVSEKLPLMLKSYEKLEGPILIYCFRGGMRSNSICGLLKGIGMDVTVLEGGYKEYRKWVREELEKEIDFELYALYGLTGSGKTEILCSIDNSLDLEGLAQHRGSVFGDIGLEPRSQKMFESLLLFRMNELKGRVFVEGESRKIGQVQIPLVLWNKMQGCKKIKVVSEIDERVERIYNEYCKILDVELFSKKLDMIEKYLGKKKVFELKLLLEKGELKEVIRVLLLDYYDKLYAHTVDSKEYEFEIKNKKELLDFFNPIHS